MSPPWQAQPTSKSSVGAPPFSSEFPYLITHLESFRPPNAIELREGGEIVVSFDDNLQTVCMKSAQLASGPEKDGFTFDRVFPMGTQQQEVFDYGVKE